MANPRRWLGGALLGVCLGAGSLAAAPLESLDGYYAREGNDASPAQAACDLGTDGIPPPPAWYPRPSARWVSFTLGISRSALRKMR